MGGISFSDSQAFDVAVHGPGLELLPNPVWFYDSKFCCNIWGNRAALDLFGVDEATFKAPQLERLVRSSQEELSQWKSLNERLREQVEGLGQEVLLDLWDKAVLPGCPAGQQPSSGISLSFRPANVVVAGSLRRMALVQVAKNQSEVEENHLRMVEICNNHPMFQFLFDENGKLLAANQRAMLNMKEHLGSCEKYTLQMYLSIGECDGSTGPDQMYQEAMSAIFKEDKPCHRFPQLRWSKRHAGKYRWVLYEMWPLQDPVTHKRAVLVCEQNITQVKTLEDSFKKQNKRLEAQLEEALAQRDPAHKPAIDIDTPADKTLKLLDKLMRGLEVTPREAMELRDAILHAGDLRQPVNLQEQLMRNSNTVLDNEVSQSLLQLLSSRRPTKPPEEPGRPGLNSRFSRSVRDLSRPDSTYSGFNSDDSDLGDEQNDESTALISLAKDMPDQLMGILAKVDDWQFDAFKLSEASGGRPLSLLSYILFKRCDILEKWHLDEHKMVKFFMKIEEGCEQLVMISVEQAISAKLAPHSY